METTDPCYAPLEPAFLAAPWDFYRWLRDWHPVWRDPASGAYFVSRFEDVWEVSTQWPQFRSEPLAGSRQHFASMDPPQHDRHRSKVSRLFTPRAISRMRAQVETACTELLQPLSGSDRFDSISAFTELLPNLMVSRIVGVPPEVDTQFRTRAVALGEAAGTPGYDAAMTALEDTARSIIDGRHPPLPGGIAAQLRGDATDKPEDALELDEMVGLVTNLVLAGTDTVTHLLSSAIVLLDHKPALRAQLQREPELIPAAVEEFLRLESPAQLLFRRTDSDTVLHGVVIPAQADVRLVWGAANRDEREFPDPDDFALHRAATRHLAFGHGLHFCLGAALARLEAQTALAALLPLLDSYRVDYAAAERLRSIVFRGYRHLPLQRAD